MMLNRRFHTNGLLFVIFLFLHGAQAWSDIPANAPISITIEHDRNLTPLAPENSKLSGELLVEFYGRIEPHENTRIHLFDESVKKIEETFESIKLPDGWKCDTTYEKNNVILYNFRPNRAPAFPTAEGFGKYTIGGRGGKVYEVTQLGDSGPGSLREACEAEGPRTVIFRVSGNIELKSRLEIKHPFITIAGQTAPGDGICVKNYMLKIETSQVIIRYMRFRPGDVSGKEEDGFGGDGDHIVVDHCSVSWGIDEVFSINKSSNVSVQWCMITESLYHSIHKKGNHGYGGLWGGPGASYHHNILAHHSSRNPRASGNEDSGLLDHRNNVIYNWGFNSAYGGELWPRNWVNNYYKYGPATDEKVRARIFQQKDPRGKMYCDGNFVWGFKKITKDNWSGGIDFADDGEASEKTLRVDTPYVVAPVTTQSAEDAYTLVLDQAGANIKRDSVDTRIIEEIRMGTAQYGASYKGGGKGIIDSQEDVGGWPELKNTGAPPDTDHDGIPDAWERTHLLNPIDPMDGAKIPNNSAYTSLEEYLNSICE